MNSYPPTHFWQSGQSFLIFAPPGEWDKVISNAASYYQNSPFDLYLVGKDMTITIEEIRQLGSEAYKFPSQGSVKLCVVLGMDHCTDEAANSLLKVLEEPPDTTRFLLISETRQILPTIRSRCISWTIQKQSDGDTRIIVPIDKTRNFATVSLELSTAGTSGKANEILDQWTEYILKHEPNRKDALHWLIESRVLINNSPVNVQALLEVIYLHIVNGLPLPLFAKR